MNAQVIDRDIMNLDRSIFSKPNVRSIRVFPERELDLDIVNLAGDLFDEDAGPHKIEADGDVQTWRPTAEGRRRKTRIVKGERWLATLLGTTIGVAFGGLAIFGIEATSQVPTPQTAAAVVPQIQAPLEALFDAAKPMVAPEPSTEVEVARMPADARQEVTNGSRSVVAASVVAGQGNSHSAQKQNTVQRSAVVASGIDKGAAATAISVAAARARGCLDDSDARRTMPVRVTFAPSGRVTTAMVVDGPFTGTSEGSCIATSLRTARVGPFDGPTVAVLKTVQIR